MPQIRPLVDIVHSKYSFTYLLLTYLLTYLLTCLFIHICSVVIHYSVFSLHIILEPIGVIQGVYNKYFEENFSAIETKSILFLLTIIIFGQNKCCKMIKTPVITGNSADCCDVAS